MEGFSFFSTGHWFSFRLARLSGSLFAGSRHPMGQRPKLLLMSSYYTRSLFVIALTLALHCVPTNSRAQSVAPSEKPQSGAVAVKIPSPIYPPVARAARIAGDVDVRFAIRQDGSIASAEVLSGHPLLRPTVLNSTENARFECRNCTEATTYYRLVYTFEIEGQCECETPESRSLHEQASPTYPRITDAPNRLTVTAEILCICDPGSDFKKKRSLKCLYLWRCSY
jgi:TonB family protein